MTASQLEVTGLRAHRAWQERAFPPVERVTDRVWSVPVPVPDSPIRYTFCYLLMGDDDAVVVDPWLGRPTGMAPPWPLRPATSPTTRCSPCPAGGSG
jgi:hypothetical protein